MAVRTRRRTLHAVAAHTWRSRTRGCSPSLTTIDTGRPICAFSSLRPLSALSADAELFVYVLAASVAAACPSPVRAGEQAAAMGGEIRSWFF